VTTLDKPLYLLVIVDVRVTVKSFPQTIRKVNVTKRIVIGVVEKLFFLKKNIFKENLFGNKIHQPPERKSNLLWSHP